VDQNKKIYVHLDVAIQTKFYRFVHEMDQSAKNSVDNNRLCRLISLFSYKI